MGIQFAKYIHSADDPGELRSTLTGCPAQLMRSYKPVWSSRKRLFAVSYVLTRPAFHFRGRLQVWVANLQAAARP